MSPLGRSLKVDSHVLGLSCQVRHWPKILAHEPIFLNVSGFGGAYKYVYQESVLAHGLTMKIYIHCHAKNYPVGIIIHTGNPTTCCVCHARQPRRQRRQRRQATPSAAPATRDSNGVNGVKHPSRESPSAAPATQRSRGINGVNSVNGVNGVKKPSRDSRGVNGVKQPPESHHTSEATSKVRTSKIYAAVSCLMLLGNLRALKLSMFVGRNTPRSKK